MIRAGGHDVRVRMASTALECLWGAGMGIDRADQIVERYRDMIEEIVGDKLIAGAIGEIVVDGLDVEG